MAGASLFALLDDIATLLDDIAGMTKMAVEKTAGVLGDDLALNAHQVSGIHANRELPVVWSVAKGSMWNKGILVPSALLISALAPWAVMPLLMAGGLYLCFEGVEKLVHRWLHSKEEADSDHDRRKKAIANPEVDMVQFERDKIRGAIRTDFVLSAEIIVITLGAVANEKFVVQVAVLIAISMIMTIGVYGLVAGIVKLDDLGSALATRSGASVYARTLRSLGKALIRFAPWLLRFLSIAGTIAMFLVGGHIIVEGLPGLHDTLHRVVHLVEERLPWDWLVSHVTNMLLDLGIGLLSGVVVLVIVEIGKRLLRPAQRRPAGHE